MTQLLLPRQIEHAEVGIPSFALDPGLVLYLPLYELDGASFISKDHYGHLCTATGALWRPNGRYFDGVNDRIVIANAFSEISVSQPFTIILWVKIDAGADGTIFANSLGANDRVSIWIKPASNNFLGLCAWDGFVGLGKGQELFTDSTYFYHLACLGAGDHTYTCFVDAVPATNSRYPGTAANVGARLGEDTQGLNDFEGYIGEGWIYNYQLPFGELQHHFSATKWRYK